jgi:RNA polymerase sigma-70 factor (ECF subfamily)
MVASAAGNAFSPTLTRREPSVPALDEELLNRARRGDASAFQELIRPHLPSLRRFVFSFCRRWDDADDLAQEALIKAFRTIASFEGRSSLSTWLYAVCRNVCHDYYRGRLAKERGREDPLEDVHDDPRDSQHTLLGAKSDSLALWAAVKSLEPEFRVAVVLFDIEGLSYEQIAGIERVPVGTIRSRLSRGRAKLKEILQRRAAFTAPPGTLAGAASSDGEKAP